MDCRHRNLASQLPVPVGQVRGRRRRSRPPARAFGLAAFQVICSTFEVVSVVAGTVTVSRLDAAACSVAAGIRQDPGRLLDNRRRLGHGLLGAHIDLQVDLCRSVERALGDGRDHHLRRRRVDRTGGDRIASAEHCAEHGERSARATSGGGQSASTRAGRSSAARPHSRRKSPAVVVWSSGGPDVKPRARQHCVRSVVEHGNTGHSRRHGTPRGPTGDDVTLQSKF